MKTILACVVVLMLGQSVALAAKGFRVARIFGEGMVLQRGMPVPVWGRAAAGEEVTVSFAGQNVRAKAGRDGHWRVDLAPLKCPAGNGGREFRVRTGGKEIVFKDVLVGEVWLCGGQSNMAFALDRAASAETAVPQAKHPEIRLCDVSGKRTTVEEALPQELGKADWQRVTPGTAANFSSVAYFFGRDLHAALDVPVGLIDTSVGGTPMRYWMSREALESEESLRGEVRKFDEKLAKQARKVEAYKAYVSGGKKGKEVKNPGAMRSSYRLAYFYESRIRLLQPLAVKGVLWYQGESDAGRHAIFAREFMTLINEWREGWKRPDMPWLFVQLAPYSKRDGRKFPLVWEAQEKVAATENAAMVAILDAGEADNIHPAHKEVVGKRLARLARGMVYGEKKVNVENVTFAGALRDGAALRARFENTGEGLRPVGEKLAFFKIAGADRKFHPAQAQLDEDGTVRVKSDEVKKPMALRYGWYGVGDEVGASLFRKDGTPVLPFRSDDW